MLEKKTWAMPHHLELFIHDIIIHIMKACPQLAHNVDSTLIQR